MPDIPCAVCGAPWDARSRDSIDMAPREAALFFDLAGCPCCEGTPDEGDDLRENLAAHLRALSRLLATPTDVGDVLQGRPRGVWPGARPLQGDGIPPPRFGRGGWPLVASPTFPGERTLACPKCGSGGVEMTVAYPPVGTGPGGRGRLGDPGSSEVNRCVSCGYTHRWRDE
jgi:hypothetical protein